MYETFFDLKTLPFKITPDPSFIYWDAAHKRAASVLAFGIEQLVPITVVTGDVGTGKTTLLQHFLEEAPRETTIGMLSNFWSGMGGLYQWILNAYDIQCEGSPVQQYRAFEDFVISEYAAGRRCVLIVDEAQNISDEDLEQLRMLTNINARKDCLVMLFLVGQPELRDRLKQPNNRQIAQRVGAAFHLGPMSLEDTGHYIRHRIAVAGGTREIFAENSIEPIYRATGGVPRLINVVCELALVTAFGDGVERIDAEFMDEFLAEAAETGLIAHLPNAPTVPVAKPKPHATDTGSPGGQASPAFRKSASQGGGKPSIRLVSDPWETKETAAYEAEPQAPAARMPEPPEEHPPESEPEPAEPEAEALSGDEALDLSSSEPIASPEPLPARKAELTAKGARREPEAGMDADKDEAPAGDPQEQAEDIASPHQPEARSRRGGVIIAVIGLAVAAAYGASVWLDREADTEVALVDTPSAPAQEQPEDTPDEPSTFATDPLAETPVLPAESVTLPDSSEAAEPVTADATTVAQPAADLPTQTDAAAGKSEIAESAAPPNPGVLLDDPDGDMLLERALTAGISDAFAAVIDYSRAALRGNDRAAYYLGQLFETGAGVPRDVAAARAWYEKAEPEVRSARRRLADLEVPKSVGALAAPVPLLGGALADGSAEFVWIGGIGAAPEYFMVEMIGEGEEIPTRLEPTRITAMSAPDPGAARQWRVIAFRPASSDYTVSGWYDMGPSDQDAPVQAGTVAPVVSIWSATGFTEDTVALLEAAGIPASHQQTPVADIDGAAVSYAYDADRPAAERVASLLGQDLNVVQVSAAPSENEFALPGQLTVILE